MTKSPLISVAELRQSLGNPGLKVFDVRGTWQTPARALHEEYLESHIPGAGFIDWTQEFIETGGPLNLAAVANQQAAAQSFRKLGINADDDVVLYDNYHHMFAGRIWWAMRYWGFESVRVLDGGWTRWVSADCPTVKHVPDVRDGFFEPTCRADRRIDLESFLANSANACVLDARGAANYVGKPEDHRTGHIPGAINVPYSAVLDTAEGTFLPPDAIEDVFNVAAPSWRDRPIIASCGSGYAATVIMLALETLDMPSTLYDGSFAEWKQDANREVQQS